jgi:hypothetical protein
MDDFYANNAITIWIAAIVFHVSMGLLAQAIAERKGHTGRWLWAGLLLSLIGVLWAAGLPDDTLRRQVKQLGERGGRQHEHIEQIAPVEAAQADGMDGPELAAVLTAAVTAMEVREGKRFVMKSFRPAGAAGTPWSRADRRGMGRAYSIR